MLALLAFFMIVSMHEMYKAVEATGVSPVHWAGYTYCALIIAAEATKLLFPSCADLTMVALLLSVMGATTHLVLQGKIAMDRLLVTVFPMFYPGIFFIALMELLQFENPAVVTAALTLAFFAASVNDVFALFAGMLFGKHKLSSELSPKKTIEGSIGGLVASTIFSSLLPTLLRLVFQSSPSMDTLPPIWAFALLGLLTGAFSQIGDLTASMVKRHCGIKDYGKLLPGHGGVMDRMDGVLFCGAICYIFLKLFGLG